MIDFLLENWFYIFVVYSWLFAFKNALIITGDLALVMSIALIVLSILSFYTNIMNDIELMFFVILSIGQVILVIVDIIGAKINKFLLS